MHDKGKVLIGIAIFLALVLFPLWYSAAQGGDAKRPDLGDVKKATGAEACVRSGHVRPGLLLSFGGPRATMPRGHQ